MRKDYVSILCDNPTDREEQFEYATREAEQLTKELNQWVNPNIEIRIKKNRHVMGWSIGAEFLFSGEVVREYDPADLCFLDAHSLVMKAIMQTWKKEEQT